MDNNTNTTFKTEQNVINNSQTPTPVVINTPPSFTPPPVSKPVKSKRWIGYTVLVIIFALLLGGLYFWQNSVVKDKQSQLNEANKELAITKSSLKYTELVGQKEMQHTDCSKKDFSNTVIASLTPAPVNGYQAYAQFCIGDGEKVPTIEGLQDTSNATLIVFKVNDDGSRTFVAGTGTSSPLCFSNKLINQDVAQALSSATKVPLCK